MDGDMFMLYSANYLCPRHAHLCEQLLTLPPFRRTSVISGAAGWLPVPYPSVQMVDQYGLTSRNRP